MHTPAAGQLRLVSWAWKGRTEVADDLAEAVVLAFLALAARHQGSVDAYQLRLVCVLRRRREGARDSDEGEDAVDEMHRDCA